MKEHFKSLLKIVGKHLANGTLKMLEIIEARFEAMFVVQIVIAVFEIWIH